MEKRKKINALNLKLGDTIIYKGYPNCNLRRFTIDKTYTVKGTYNGRYGIIVSNDTGDDEKIENSIVEKFFIPYYVQDSITKPSLNIEDNVNHPKHYTSHPSGIECIDITRHYCFSVGNAIKYLWRAGLKKDASLEDKQKEIEDLEKSIWYINDRIKQLKES